MTDPQGPDDGMASDPFAVELADAEGRDVTSWLLEGGLTDILAAAVEPLPGPKEGAAAPGLRARLLASAALPGRLHRFAEEVAALLDVSVGEARVFLDAIDEPSAWEPGPEEHIDLYHVQGGPAVAGAITGFVRLPSGTAFPSHRHLGEERVLVVQGAYRDDAGTERRAGDTSVMRAGTRHRLDALPGPPLVYLAVVFDGVDIGGVVMGPDDPRL